MQTLLRGLKTRFCESVLGKVHLLWLMALVSVAGNLTACSAQQKAEFKQNTKQGAKDVGHAVRDAARETGHFFRDTTKEIFSDDEGKNKSDSNTDNPKNQ